MKKVIVLDVGLEATGKEAEWFISEIFPELGITDYEIYGFEPCKKSFDAVVEKFRKKPRMHIYRLAINSFEGMCRLYHAVGPAGHSIYKTKNNVPNAEDFEDVECTRMSEFIKKNISDEDWDGAVRVLRFNAEGGEWPLIEDLDERSMLKQFDIVSGNFGGDIVTVSELDGKMAEFNEIMKKNGVRQIYFCFTDPVANIKAKSEMKARLKELLNL